MDLKRDDGEVDWMKVYHPMASRQVVEDIEAVRQDLFSEHPETKISLLGGSGGGLLVHESLAQHPIRAARAFTLVAPNPQVMERMGNPTSRKLMDGLDEIDPALVHGQWSYDHPEFDLRALSAQRRRQEVQGGNRRWYAGAYWGYGFHEDGTQSGFEAAGLLTAAPTREQIVLAA